MNDAYVMEILKRVKALREDPPDFIVCKWLGRMLVIEVADAEVLHVEGRNRFCLRETKLD